MILPLQNMQLYLDEHKVKKKSDHNEQNTALKDGNFYKVNI